MNINELSNSKYLKTKDVPEPIIVTIKYIEVVNVAMDNKPKEEKPVLTFKELDKPMVMNSTNLKRTAKALNSEETDDWEGKKVVLYTDEDVEFGGEIVGGLRIRRYTASKAAPAPAESENPAE